MSRKLASIQRIENIEPIEGADRIMLATVLGWKTIVRKDEFEIGDHCVYIEIDSMLPDADSAFHFLTRKSESKEPKNYRLKTIRMRGTLSQGLAMPLTSFPVLTVVMKIKGTFRTGTDITEALNIVQYEPPELSSPDSGVMPFSRKMHAFPKHLVPATDEMRLQSVPAVLDELQDGDRISITEKLDGTSATYMVTREKYKFLWFRFGSRFDHWICSRGRRVQHNAPNHKTIQVKLNVYHEQNNHYSVTDKLEDFLKSTGRTLAIQGEIVGPKIQSNPLNYQSRDFYVHNIYDVDERRHLNPSEMYLVAQKFGLKPVPHISTHEHTFSSEVPANTVDWWLTSVAEDLDANQEGIVIRASDGRMSKALGGTRLSFKIVNNNYLLKHANQ